MFSNHTGATGARHMRTTCVIFQQTPIILIMPFAYEMMFCLMMLWPLRYIQVRPGIRACDCLRPWPLLPAILGSQACGYRHYMSHVMSWLNSSSSTSLNFRSCVFSHARRSITCCISLWTRSRPFVTSKLISRSRISHASRIAS